MGLGIRLRSKGVDLMENKNRELIMQNIRDNPGVKMRKIAKLSGLCDSVVNYHLGVLDDTESFMKDRDDRYWSWEQRPIISNIRGSGAEGMPEDKLKALFRNATFDLAKSLNVMVDEGLVVYFEGMYYPVGCSQDIGSFKRPSQNQFQAAFSRSRTYEL